MIIDEFVEVQLNSNQTFDAVQYWTEKGYTNLRPQQKLKVRVVDLPKFSGAMVTFKCDGCGHIYQGRYSKKFLKRTVYTEDLCYPCSRNRTCQYTNRNHKTNKGWKSGRDHHNWNPNKSDFKKYAYEVRKLTETNYKKYKEIINPTDLPRTLCGVDGGYQLDHKISIKSGFNKGHSPNEIACIQNLQMLPWSENRSKW